MKRTLIATLFAFTSIASAKPSGAKPQAPTEQARPKRTDVVNVNEATETQLKLLPGVGDKTAEAMIAARPLKCSSLDEDVKGIGPAKQAAIEPHCVDGKGEPTTLTVKVKGAGHASK